MFNIRKVLKFIATPFRIGFEGERLHHQNQLTLITNSLALFAILAGTSHIFNFIELGYSWLTIGLVLADVYLMSPIVLLANYKKKHTFARFFTILTTVVIGIRGYAIAARTINVHLVFFIGVVLSIICFRKDQKKLRWGTLAMTLAGYPIGDYLVHTGVFPLLDIEWEYSIRLIDGILMPVGVAILVFMQKNLSEQYSQQLEEFNETLEAKVKERTHELFLAKEEVEQASVLKNQFFANTSHELRTPVQGIKGHLQLMEVRINKLKPDAIPASKTRLLKNVGLMREANDRLSSLINRLLDLTKIQKGDFKSQAAEFSFNDVIQSSSHEFLSDAKEKNIQLEVPAENLENQICVQDKALCEQILKNLMGNAVKFAEPDSKVKVLCELTAEDIRVRISNKGPGIDQGELDKIFEPFVQGSRTDQLVGGTGLGLSFCRKYARVLGGDVKVFDSSPENTVFELSLPRYLEGSVTFALSG